MPLLSIYSLIPLVDKKNYTRTNKDFSIVK